MIATIRRYFETRKARRRQAVYDANLKRCFLRHEFETLERLARSGLLDMGDFYVLCGRKRENAPPWRDPVEAHIEFEREQAAFEVRMARALEAKEVAPWPVSAQSPVADILAIQAFAAQHGEPIEDYWHRMNTSDDPEAVAFRERWAGTENGRANT